MKIALLLILWITGSLCAFYLGSQTSPKTPPSSLVQTKSKQVPTRSAQPSPAFSTTRDFVAQLQGYNTSQEFEDAFQELAPSLQEPGTHDQLFLLADQWAALFPEQAALWLNKLAFNDTRNPFLFSALTQWGQQSPHDALSWVNATYTAENPTRDYLLAALVRGIVKSDPEQALSLLLQAPPSPERTGSLDFLLNAWSQQGLDHAFTQIESLPASEPKLRLHAFQRLFADLLPSEIPQAKALLESLPASIEQQNATLALASKWAQTDPADALQWATQINSPITQAKAIGSVALPWSRQDPQAATDWLADKQDPQYDYALRAVAGTLIAAEPATALTQISRITDPSLKEQTFEQLGRIWLSKDPLGFRATMATDTPMPAAIHETLLQNFR